ncbi:hypothetical protein Dimus_027230, partial [Dionaea muscipula]
VPSLWKSGTVKFKTIQQHLSGPYLSPTEVAKGYLLWLLAATLFPDKTQGSMSISYCSCRISRACMPMHGGNHPSKSLLSDGGGILSRHASDCRLLDSTRDRDSDHDNRDSSSLKLKDTNGSSSYDLEMGYR